MKAVIGLNTELIVFIVYLCFMVGIGLVFFLRSRGGGEKEYFLDPGRPCAGLCAELDF